MESPLTTRAALLLALRDGPGYGSDLIRRVAERTAGAIRLSAARVYPSLKALQRAKLVRASRVVPGGRRGARARTYYELTVGGITASRELRDAVSVLATGRPRPIVTAGEKRRMAERILLGGELSALAAGLAFPRVKRG
jgi:DNA-binding PadR family transcriptional regulator